MVATKVPDWGEFVLAELTQPFNQPDVSYFQPLMTATEQRLGFRPPYAAFDAAFDAFYIYEYFDQPLAPAPDALHGFAAVPFSERGGHKLRFDSEGRPLCQADLAMPLRYTFRNKIDPRRARTGPLRVPATLARSNRRKLPRGAQTMGQRWLYHDHPDQRRRTSALSA